MNTANIPAETWEELRTKYPGAYDLLQTASLKAEFKTLRRELELGISSLWRTAWVTERLTQLETFTPYLDPLLDGLPPFKLEPGANIEEIPTWIIDRRLATDGNVIETKVGLIHGCFWEYCEHPGEEFTNKITSDNARTKIMRASIEQGGK